MSDDPRKLAQDALTRANDTPPGAYAPQYWHDVPALARALLEALDERDRANDLLDGNAREVMVNSLTFEAGSMELWARHPIFSIFAVQMVEFFIESGGKNYLEISIGSSVGDITMTLQKASGKTPHQLKVEALDQLAAAQAREARLRAVTDMSLRTLELIEFGDYQNGPSGICPVCGYPKRHGHGGNCGMEKSIAQARAALAEKP